MTAPRRHRRAEVRTEARLWSSAPQGASLAAVFGPMQPEPARQVWGVGALLLAAGDALAARFGALAVRGELGNLVRAASGHCYFSLKDGSGTGATLRCAMFRRAAALVDFRLADGLQVELRGRLGVYEPRGELQFIVESIERVGAGTLYEEFLRLRARLEAQGLFDPARKRPLPAHPRALGIVTSLGAAALHDVLTCLARRAPQVAVVVYPSLVQGADAPPTLAAAIALAGRRAEVDTLLVVRGGGSLEDLWAFNDERVVRAIVASPLPVVCGVGHETDVTLADLAADLRAPTPTAAAELAAPAQAELHAALASRARSLRLALARALQRAWQRLDTAALRLGRPATTLVAQRARLEALERRLGLARVHAVDERGALVVRRSEALQRALSVRLERERARLALLDGRLQALDPTRVLQRGYAWVEDAAGRPVLSVAALARGDEIRAVWADGRALAQVLGIEPASPPPPPR